MSRTRPRRRRHARTAAPLSPQPHSAAGRLALDAAAGRAGRQRRLHGVRPPRDAAPRRAGRANLFHRLEIAAAAQHHFDEMRYWMTDLSVSLLTLSERRAARGAGRSSVTDLDQIAAFAPEVRPSASATRRRRISTAPCRRPMPTPTRTASSATAISPPPGCTATPSARRCPALIAPAGARGDRGARMAADEAARGSVLRAGDRGAC